MIKLADFCKAGLLFVETQFSPYLSTASIFLQLLETSLSQTRLDGVSLITTLARPLNQTHCIDDCGTMAILAHQCEAVLSSRTTCAPIHTTLKDATGRQLYLATNFASPERHHSKIVSTTENQPPAIPRLPTFDVRKVVQQFREVTESRQQSSNDCKLTTLLRIRMSPTRTALTTDEATHSCTSEELSDSNDPSQHRLNTLTCFGKLAIELRTIIWRFSLPRQRKVHVNTRINLDTSGKFHLFSKSHSRSSSIFWVNRDSRAIALKHYRALLQDSSNPRRKT